MHAEAFEFVQEIARKHGPFSNVLDVGGRDVNGSPRHLFPRAKYTVIDRIGGPGVDIVMDIRHYVTQERYDCILCLEVLEHTPVWESVLWTCRELLMPGGTLIVTAAGPRRRPHSEIDGSRVLRPNEWYRNVTTDEVANAVAGMSKVACHYARNKEDVHAAFVEPPWPESRSAS